LSRLAAGDALVTWPVEATGRALRVLHEAPVPPLVAAHRHGLEEEVAATLRAAEVVDGLAPATGRRLRDGVLAAADRVRDGGARAPRWTHGDVKGDNILVGEDAVSLLDFDRGALADPALDVGKALADLWWWAPDDPSAERLQGFLLGGYGSEASDRSLLDRARAYERLFVLKLAARRAPVHEPQWGQTVERAVTRAASGVRAGAA
jgi:aminoglycoside phosphotransferase (APT) family kinase protein